MSLSPTRILVVDDMPANLGLLVDHLENHGIEVLVALGGQEALDRLAFVEPDLILLDVMMPEMDGFETCRRLKDNAKTESIPVIFMTALTDVKSKVAAFEAGGVDYVEKPFQIEELIARVKTHVALRRAGVALLAQKSDLEAESLARQQSEALLRESEIRHRRLFETAGDGILIIDCDALVVHDLNPRCADIFGTQPEAIRGHSIEDLPMFAGLGNIRGLIEGLRQTGHTQWDEWSWERSDGTVLVVEAVCATYHLGEKTMAQCTLRDVRARKEAEARVRYLALHDALTGLPNRTLFMDRLSQDIARARRANSHVGLLLLDLDHFKNINDSLGHFVGDALLEAVAQRLRSVLRDCDTPARLGGDEFVIAAGDLTDVEGAERLALRISEVLAPEFLIEGHTLRISTSIGISLFPDDGDNAATLLQAADTAMYQAKRNGRGNYRLFSKDLTMAAERWHTLSNDLHGACERGEFVIHYQPQVSAENSTITGLEALLRWDHPKDGLIQPSLFIPLLEEHGRMVEVGRWVLHTACAQNAAWQAQGFPTVPVAVNLSAQQFYRGDIVRTVKEALLTSNLAAEWLELELTESLTLDDSDVTIRVMEELKAMGIKLSLDDFGTGWSSLAYLRHFPLDRIKIDRSFVRDIVNDPNTAAIVHSILRLARDLNLDCVAEGVETQEQLDHLRSEQCSNIQGYLFSRPLNTDDMTKLFASQELKAAEPTRKSSPNSDVLSLVRHG
jgi:diguanylate cyclase (GGDEF)-like protein/PAS domain S-box-containing protein